jgi:hypothetical protein
MKEGSARYKAAQTAGTLGDQSGIIFAALDADRTQPRCLPQLPRLPLPLPKLSVAATSDFLVKATTFRARRYVAKVLEAVFKARMYRTMLD